MAKTITVKLINSTIGRKADQKATAIGLGLTKLHKQVTLQDNPAMRGMIDKISHLVRIIEGGK